MYTKRNYHTILYKMMLQNNICTFYSVKINDERFLDEHTTSPINWPLDLFCSQNNMRSRSISQHS